MEAFTDISIKCNRKELFKLIQDLTDVLNSKGKPVMIPYGHPDKKNGKSYKYMKSGYDPTNQVITVGDTRLTIWNTDS